MPEPFLPCRKCLNGQVERPVSHDTQSLFSEDPNELHITLDWSKSGSHSTGDRYQTDRSWRMSSVGANGLPDGDHRGGRGRQFDCSSKPTAIEMAIHHVGRRLRVASRCAVFGRRFNRSERVEKERLSKSANPGISSRRKSCAWATNSECSVEPNPLLSKDVDSVPEALSRAGEESTREERDA